MPKGFDADVDPVGAGFIRDIWSGNMILIDEIHIFLLCREKLNAADKDGQVGQEVGQLINARIKLMFTKHSHKRPNIRKREHLRAAFRKFVTKLQSEFFNPRIPQWTGYISLHVAYLSL